SLGVEYVNSNFLSYTGRRCPSSFSELRTNISKNIRTCAKACSVFLDSSFGLACAMGVVGLTTSSLCAGEDVLALMTTTILPSTAAPTTFPVNISVVNDPDPHTKMVILCFHKTVDYLGSNVSLNAWASNFSQMCHTPPVEIDCSSILNDSFVNDSLSSIQCGNLGLFGSTQHVSHDVSSFGVLRGDGSGLINALECVKTGVFYVANHTVHKALDVLNLKQATCKISNGSDSFYPRSNVDPFCFDNSNNYSYSVIDLADIQRRCLVPFDSASSPSTVASFVEATMVDSCNACSTATVVFGVGSASVLVLTTIKALYQQHKVRKLHHSRGSYVGLRQATAIMLDEGLLLAASGLGSSVLMTSLLHPCNPVDASVKNTVLASTILYGVSAASKMFGALACGAQDSEKSLDEVVIIEMQDVEEEVEELEINNMMMTSYA
ncbi:hypothetical protein, partial [Candidatus Clavichlamydia salmonicola]|uniref:hypothetical protein n=1 Tax=Candidatus Clavichlamydia salmonicola TaxID=469812 RepID=UPI001891062E